MKHFGWTHEKLCAYHALRRAGHSTRVAARMALRGLSVVRP